MRNADARHQVGSNSIILVLIAFIMAAGGGIERGRHNVASGVHRRSDDFARSFHRHGDQRATGENRGGRKTEEDRVNATFHTPNNTHLAILLGGRF
jgi:hypothetical protein